MPALNFPAGPTSGQTFTGTNGITYIYLDSVWQVWSLGDAGRIDAFPGTTVPAGWTLADGGSRSRSGDFAALWGYAQTSGNLAATQDAKTAAQFGPGDGSTTFTLPDYRGYFLRGLNTSGSGIDPGRAIGTPQQDQIQDHAHNIRFNDNSGTVAGSDVPRLISAANLLPNASSDGINTQVPTGASAAGRKGTETRPSNVAVLICLKL